MIVVIIALSLAGVFILLIGMIIGIRLGREMAETKVIDHANRNPLDYAYELTDELYPERRDIMIEIPARQGHRIKNRFEILKEHWSLN